MVWAESKLSRTWILLVRLLLFGRLTWVYLTRMLLHHHLLVSWGVCIAILLVLVSLSFATISVVRIRVLELRHVARIWSDTNGATMDLLLSTRLHLCSCLRLRRAVADVVRVARIDQTIWILDRLLLLHLHLYVMLISFLSRNDYGVGRGDGCHWLVIRAVYNLKMMKRSFVALPLFHCC